MTFFQLSFPSSVGSHVRNSWFLVPWTTFGRSTFRVIFPFHKHTFPFVSTAVTHKANDWVSMALRHMYLLLGLCANCLDLVSIKLCLFKFSRTSWVVYLFFAGKVLFEECIFEYISNTLNYLKTWLLWNIHFAYVFLKKNCPNKQYLELSFWSGDLAIKV